MPKTFRQITLDAYIRNPEYFATRLDSLFKVIVTEQDKILHNEIADEIRFIIGDKPNGFYTEVVRLVVEKKDFIKRVIETIRNYGMRRSETK